MLIKTHVLSLTGIPVLHATTAISAQDFFQVGKPHLEIASKKNQEWAAEAILYFGDALVDLIKSGIFGAMIDQAAVQVAVAVWVFDSLYENLDADTLAQCDLALMIYQDGAIEYVFRPVRIH